MTWMLYGMVCMKLQRVMILRIDILKSLQTQLQQKKAFQFSGIPLEYRGLFTGFYFVNYKKYKAFYRVRDSYLEVIRIIMSKSDYIKMLFGEQEEPFDDF